MSTYPQMTAAGVSVRRLSLVLGTVLITWLLAPAADAHLRSGTLAVDYQVTLRDRATVAYEARIYQSDHGLTLTVRRGHVVVLVGYLGEPVFRLDGDGLAINAASPTAVAARLLAKGAAVDSPTPAWRSYRGRHSATWHDARAQGLPPGVAAGTWHVPLIVDGRRTVLEGELRRFPRPALWPWLAILAAWLIPGAWLAVASGRPRLNFRSHAYSSRERKFTSSAGEDGVLPPWTTPRATVLATELAAAAAAISAIGFALDAYASPGTWILGFDAIAFLGAGLGMLLRGPEHLRPAGAIGAGLVALATGLFMIPVFLHPIVLSVLPAALTRLLAVTSMGAGVTAAALGGRAYAATAFARAEGEGEGEAATWMV